MNKEELILRLKPIVDTYAQDKAAMENLNDHTDFIKDLHINSANLVDLVLDIEEQFDIEIDNTSMEKMLTIGAAIEIIQEKINTNDR
ncbi:acyl carrier protein [Pedobacter nutrimenti]|jgi:acyl carrier protein|uniref:Acyl carrier protein n=1 Tax=Pedobacter nutrimenti TaxID=1241337 RepID=A0A318ULD6_9SPHI|nr:phosphopantetheine-binding protein [Pedobacter nutrimenti]PYF76701.1 acyl carrier protein [Pedobacter nutrimenti]